MSIQSDISSFFDQINLNEDDMAIAASSDQISSAISNPHSAFLDPLQKYQSIDMYDLLLNKDSVVSSHDSQKPPPNERLYLLQTKYNLMNSSSNSPINTINPRKLNNSNKASVSSSSSSNASSNNPTSSSSDLDSTPIVEDSNSISSVDDDEDDIDLDDDSISPSFTTKPTRRRTTNWSMNDEFKNAIQEWLSQNEIRAKRHSVSENSNPVFQRTSISKRRKSESSVAFHTNPYSSNSLGSSNDSTSSTVMDPSISIMGSMSSTSSASSKNIPTTKSTQLSSASTVSKSKSTTPSTIPPSTSSTSHHHQQQHSHSHSLSSTSLQDLPEEEKPFKCEDCPKAFRRSEHLKRHIRSVHSNIRPFPCKFCEKKFSRSDNLAQHLRTHNKH